MTDEAPTSKTVRRSLTRRSLAGAAVALAAGVAGEITDVLASDGRRGRPKRGPHHCFLAGTLIATPGGPVAIETLAVGDMVLTASGCVKSIVGIGRRRVCKAASQAWDADQLPVLIKRSAIDDNVPNRDLWVTAGHAIAIDGLLIPAARLVNGITIRREAPEGAEAFDVLHIALGDHDLVMAEGLACESLQSLDAGVMARFDTFETAPQATRVALAALSLTVVPGGHRAELASRTRSALSPVIDRRTSYDRARDRIEDRAAASL